MGVGHLVRRRSFRRSIGFAWEKCHVQSSRRLRARQRLRKIRRQDDPLRPILDGQARWFAVDVAPRHAAHPCADRARVVDAAHAKQ